MNEQPTQPRPMTRQQLRAVVYRIAVTYLEVERGLRPPDQLAAFLSPAEYRRHRVTTRGTRTAARPVRPHDIGRVLIDTSTPQRVNASAMVRRGEDDWSALVIDLKQTGQGLQVERLGRLERLLPREPRHIEIDEDAVERRIRVIEHERRAVEAAYAAASRRYERVPDKRVGEAKALRDERDQWRSRLDELQSEAASLDQRRLQAARVKTRELPNSDEHTRAQGPVETILGPRPDDPHQAGVWDRAGEALAAYEDRWNLGSPTDLLRVAGVETQESDRRDLLQLLAQAAQTLEASSTQCLNRAPGVQEAFASVEL